MPEATFDDSTKLIHVERSQCHFKVYVQQPNENWEGKTVFLTVHDVGANPHSMIQFVNSSGMIDVKHHSVFLHVCVPGQEEGAPNMTGEFPTMDQLGENLVHVLDALGVRACIGLGEGAGADILSRFAMAWPNRVLGLILIHCLATPHGIIESFKEILFNLRLDDGQMNAAAWDYLFLHRFGMHSKMLKDAFSIELGSLFNTHNLSRYLYSYSRRSDFSHHIGEKLAKTDVLLVTGARAPQNDNVRHMYESLRREKATLLIVDDVMDVLNEAPNRLSRSLILFCKGLGELTGVETPGIGRMRSTSLSMEEADRPTRKFSTPLRELKETAAETAVLVQTRQIGTTVHERK